MAVIKLTKQRILDYADLTTDRNPLHVDEVYASQSRFGGLIAHGFLLLGDPIFRASQANAYPLTIGFRFVSPGRPGDQLQTEFIDIDASSFSFEVRSGEGDVRVTGSAHQLGGQIRSSDERPV